MAVSPVRTMARTRDWEGPSILSLGFRPLFLLAGLQAVVTMAAWILWLRGDIAIPSALSPFAWHVHELLFGYVWAVVAGFLLTAVPNWTGRLPVVGLPLLGLVALWLAGRFAIAVSLVLPPPVVALVALAFPAALLLAIGREIVAGNNLRNLKVLVVIGGLLAAQITFYFEAAGGADAPTASRLALAAIVMLIMVIGGRIVPSFTTNWLRRENPGRLAAPFGRYDVACILVSVIALAGWTISPDDGPVIALPLALACGLHLVRLARWAPDRTLGAPLVLVLHLAYAFIPLGFGFAALAAFNGEAGIASAAVHAWTAGAIGLMTLAVMTRATRGHTGLPLTAPAGTVAIYALVLMAAAARIAAVFLPEWYAQLLALAGAGWVAGFALFVCLYGPLLVRPRKAA